MLHWACDRGHLEVVKFLLQSGADVNLQDKESQTALHYGMLAMLCAGFHLVTQCLMHKASVVY